MVTLVADGRYGATDSGDVSTVDAAHPFYARTATLASGGFAMTWHDENNQLFVRTFDAAGSPIGQERAIGAAGRYPAIVGLGDGGFAVSWNANTDSGGPVTVQTFDAAGVAEGAPIPASSGAGMQRRDGALLATDDGGFAIYWYDFSGSKVRLFDGGGSAISNERLIPPSEPQNQTNGLVLTGIGDDLIWAGTIESPTFPLTGPGEIVVRRMAEDGTVAGAPVINIAPSAGYSMYSLSMTELADGNVLLAWSEYVSGPSYIQHFEVYRPDGVRVADGFSRATGPFERLASVAALPDGGFVAALGGGVQADYYYDLQLFDAAGQPVGAPFGRTTASEFGAISVVPFGSGDFVVTWGEAEYFGGARTFETSFRVFYNSTSGTDVGETMTGTASVDILRGLDGADTLLGLAGDDILNGGAGADVLDGGEGNDAADYGDAATGVTINLATGAIGGGATGDTLVSIENATGSAFDDVLVGSAGANALGGGAGNDLLVGGGGADALDGGEGVDTADYTASAAGVTVNLTTGAASGGDAEGDTLTGIENVRGTAFADVLTGTNGRNLLEGLGGDDLLAGGVNADTLDGGIGRDTVSYAASINRVIVDLAAGTARGGDAENDVLRSIENVTGSAGDDMLTGDGGDNVLTGGAGADTLSGGGGFDTAAYEISAAAVTVDLGVGAGSGGDAAGDVLSGIEALIGSAFGDTFVDGAGANRYDGRGGDDVVSYARSGSGVTVSFATGAATGGSATGDVLVSIEGLVGSAFADTLEGGAGIDRLNGGEGDDLLIGRGGADDLVGGGGIDRASYAGSAAGVTVSLVAGSGSGGDAAGDRLSGIEELVGSDHADRLMGDAGANALYGGAGDDVLIGGAGGDLLDGGAGYEMLSYAVLYRGGAVTRGTGTEVVVAAGGDVGTDTLRGIDDVAMKDGLLSFDENDAWAQVVRIYDTALQRLPDGAGLDFHTGRITSGQTNLLGVATDFLNSAEFQAATGSLNNEQFVRYIYQTALDREPDAGGLTYWTGQLNSGTSRASVLVLFSESAEHRALTASSLDQGYFTTDVNYQNAALLYDTGLGRLPDAGGIVFWGDALKGGQQSIGSMAAAMAGSGEFQTRTAGFSNAQLVDYMYQNTLDRQGDAGGRAYWTAQLDAGLSKADLIQNFAFSAEHRTLLAPFIDHGIVVI